MRTLRWQLILRTAIGTTVVLLACGVLLHALIHDALWDEFDESLATKARSLAAMMEQDGNELEIEFDEANLPEFRPSDRAEVYQVWLGQSTVCARSDSLKGRDLDMIDGSLDQPGYKSVTLPDGRAGRLVGVSFIPRNNRAVARPDGRPTVTLVIGRETAGIEATIAQLSLIMVAVGSVTVLVSVCMLAWFVRRGLRPVDQLAWQIAGIGESDLSARVEPTNIPAELMPVIDRLNDLLARLESAFQRERRFTADIAHELRSPLAGVRSTLEVALSKQRDLDAYRDVMGECLVINQQMHQMVENLLGLARADAGQLEATTEKVDLSAIMAECWKPLAGLANERRLNVNWHLQQPCTVDSDRGKLLLVFTNILTNAVIYADEGGQIGIQSVSNNGQIELTVTNTGSAISQQDAQRVFDRFWRGDASRRDTGQHCGLGLSLCKTLVTLLGGSISATSILKEEFAIALRFGDIAQTNAATGDQT